jgi:hypothetical protein
VASSVLDDQAHHLASAVAAFKLTDATSIGYLLDRMLKSGTCIVTNTFWFKDRLLAAARRDSLSGAVALYLAGQATVDLLYRKRIISMTAWDSAPPTSPRRSTASK